ncbi:low molecular weight protein arginine phosphatase [Paenibacillus sp. y28]|uniref:low molecular weight protein arginine phosphatase n=1 Tax=Paenibacillus sp. y28 TaxID=3129110 RepID=UPI0030169010
MNRILFVCTGNTCRSPLAEAMMRKLASDYQITLEVRSAGVAAVSGGPASRHSQTVMKERGLPSEHQSQALSRELVEWADMVLTMTMGHKQRIVQLFPGAVDKVHTLKEYVEDDDRALQALVEKEHLISEIQLKQALSQPITESDRIRVLELERKSPSPDIADPFGGTLEDYRICAGELENALQKLLKKLQK